MKKIFTYIACLSAALLLGMTPVTGAEDRAIEELKNLSVRSNESLKRLREDVRKSIYVIKGRRPVEELPALRFYQYRVGENETFWSILSRLSLDIDTLMSVNDLTSPGEVKAGTRLFIPNMRGIIVTPEKKEELAAMLRENRISIDYIYCINGANALEKKNIFVPCGKISRLERSLFLGTGFMFPLEKGRRTSGFGTRRNPFNERRYEFHRGIDIACPLNSPVYAAREGQVVFTGYQGGYGNLIIIKHEHGYSSYYGHLDRITTEAGRNVKCGELIAYSGNTGRTTGPHLHFETRRGRRAFDPGILIKR